MTQIESGGTIKRRMVDTAARSDALQWEELAERALAVPLPYRPAPGGVIYHLRAGERDLMVAEHDLAGPLRDLVTAVMTLGDAVLATGAKHRSRHAPSAGTGSFSSACSRRVPRRAGLSMTRGGGFAAAGRAVPQQRPACRELASPGTVFAFHAVIRTRFPGVYTLGACGAGCRRGAARRRAGHRPAGGAGPLVPGTAK